MYWLFTVFTALLAALIYLRIFKAIYWASSQLRRFKRDKLGLESSVRLVQLKGRFMGNPRLTLYSSNRLVLS